MKENRLDTEELGGLKTASLEDMITLLGSAEDKDIVQKELHILITLSFIGGLQYCYSNLISFHIFITIFLVGSCFYLDHISSGFLEPTFYFTLFYGVVTAFNILVYSGKVERLNKAYKKLQ